MADHAESLSPKLETPLRLIIWGGAGLLLLLPLSAMQITSEVAWTGEDFLVAALMLGAAGGAVELGARVSSGLIYRAAYALAVAGGFLLVWSSLAHGIIGSVGNPANAMYLAVMAVLVVGSAVVRLKPAGMALVTLTTAIVFVVIAIVALMAGLHGDTFALAARVIAINGIFTVIFLASSGLFALAGHRQFQGNSAK